MEKSRFRRKLASLYKGAKVYGPYRQSNNDGRRRVVIVYKGRLLTKQYAKFKMEILLKRVLSKEETVDHIDGNVRNDRYSNLRLLSRVDNARRGALKVKVGSVSCDWCGNIFFPTKDQRANSKKAGPFCSRSCSGKYGAYVQKGGATRNRNIVKKTYYK